MAKAIMIQGTSSNCGKSLLAAGLCRMLARDGLRVAPFKSQNMALNSYVTESGLEMGRAQVMQAECAGVAPDVRMNPILLKPTGESSSQLIVNGEVVGTYSAREYYARKAELAATVQSAYDSLAADYDIIVLEGAGSPAEINLKEGDLVNMGMARMARAPVLLAGDIDRGGVFAALAGTNLLFEEWERDHFRGMIINKFRGDVEILRPGLGMLEELVGRPVLGVVPWMDIDVDDEDSLSDRLERQRPDADALVDVAVLRLPRLSNFTDFSALSAVAGVSVRYIKKTADWGHPDLVILPGSKNTMSDLRWLRESGLAARITAHAAAGGAVLGICGGYQMLGQTLRDPHGVEHGGEMAGLGLLPGGTVFLPQKTRRQAHGRFVAREGLWAAMHGTPATGYEIHMGDTVTGDAPLLELEEQGQPPRPDGAVCGNVCGSYLHGLLDDAAAVQALARSLAASKGADPALIRARDTATHRARQYDQLEETLRRSLDLPRIYEILERGV